MHWCKVWLGSSRLGSGGGTFGCASDSPHPRIIAFLLLGKVLLDLVSVLVVVTGFTQWANVWVTRGLFFKTTAYAHNCMNFRKVFAGQQPVTSSTKCILQFWQRFSRTLEKSGRTSFAWLHEFCANRGLTGKMYGRVLKIDFVPVFNTIPRARICMNFQTVFADTQLVVSSTRCIRSWVRCTVLQKKNLNYSNTGLIFKFTHSFAHTAINQPCIEKSDERSFWFFFWIFHARMHEIRKSETNLQFTHEFTQTALSKTYDNH